MLSNVKRRSNRPKFFEMVEKETICITSLFSAFVFQMSSAKLQSPLSSKQLQRRPRNQQSVNSGKSETVPEAQELVVTQGPIVTKKFHDKSELEVIFEGSKILWKLRTSIDICFALHKYTVVHIIEIVAFHPTLSEESNRIYVSLPLLESKLDENLLQARIEAKKESLTRQKKAVRLDDIRKEIQLNLMVDFLLSRVDAPSNERKYLL